MAIPDPTRYLQDTTPGLIRDLHATLASSPLVYRNRPDVDFDAILDHPDLLAAQCDDGYVAGTPWGRHLRVAYEFDSLNAIRQHLTNLLNDIGELAHARGAELITMDYNDFPHRHWVDPMLIGAGFAEPAEVCIMRLRDVRDAEPPAPAAGVGVREATAADADAIAAVEERASGEGAHAPPLDSRFLGDADWVGLADVDGEPAAFLRVIEGEKRGIVADELVVAHDERPNDAISALLGAAVAWGAERNRRALTLRAAATAVSNPVLQQFRFRHVGNELLYQRPADPAEVVARREARITTFVKVGKIFGQF